MSLAFLMESTLLLALALALGRLCSKPHQRATHGFIAVCALPLLWLADRLHLGWQPMVQYATAGSAPNAPADSAWAAHALATVYALVAVARLLRWLGAQIAGHRLERRACLCLHPGWQRLNTQVAADSGTRPLPVRVLDTIGAPFLAGQLRPGIYIPAHLLSCSDARARQVLLHEYAHLRAGDCWRVPLLELICCLLWFHPLLQLLRRQFLRDIEQACDARVLDSGEDAHDYATTLAHCAARHRRLVVAGLGMSVRQSDLAQRVRLILSDAVGTQVPSRRWIAAVLCGVALSLSALNLAPRVLIAAAPTAPAHSTIENPSNAPAAVPVAVHTGSAEVAPLVDLKRSRRSNKPIASTPVPATPVELAPTANEPPGSARLWQTLRSVAAEDATVYAASHSEPMVDTIAPDPRFEIGLRQGSAERRHQRQRVIKRLWPLTGHVPL